MHRLSTLFLLVVFLVTVSGCVNLDLSSTDEESLESLREAGSDFSQIHPFDFYLYHPEEEGAANICKELAMKGFQITVREGALGGEWLCLASFNMLPSIEKLTQLERQIEGIIGVHGGEYDGWETIVIVQ